MAATIEAVVEPPSAADKPAAADKPSASELRGSASEAKAGLGAEPEVPDPDLDDSKLWKIDGSGKGGHYHSLPSLGVVMLAQINYIVSLVVVIPTAAGYAASLGDSSSAYFGLVIGISSIIIPLVSRLWTKVISATNLNTVLLTNASICFVCSLMYASASYFGGTTMLMVSRVLLGLGSVQTANLKYLGCAVSTRRVKFTHYLTTAAIAYGFAFGTGIAFLLSVLANRNDWDQYQLPGWFTALLWLAYIVLHKLVFVEPDLQAGIVDPESRIRLDKDMRPKRRREPLASLAPCFAAIVAVAAIKGAFEVMTIQITQELWQWDVMTSAMFLGVMMLIVALTSLLSCTLERKVGEGWTFVAGLFGATLLLPFYFIPISLEYQERMTSTAGQVTYFVVTILALSCLNLGRTIAFSLITELPSPHWRGFFLSRGSELFTLGRGVGPILAGCIADRQITMAVLIGVCALAAAWVSASFSWGMLEHEEHEVGPARAELGELSADHWGQTVDDVMRDLDEWWSGLGTHCSSAGREGTAVAAPAAALSNKSMAASVGEVMMGTVIKCDGQADAASVVRGVPVATAAAAAAAIGGSKGEIPAPCAANSAKVVAEACDQV